jgi:hypothetical protein
MQEVLSVVFVPEQALKPTQLCEVGILAGGCIKLPGDAKQSCSLPGLWSNLLAQTSQYSLTPNIEASGSYQSTRRHITEHHNLDLDTFIHFTVRPIQSLEHLYSIYRVSPEERSIFGEVIVSVILSKTVYMYMCPIPNGLRDRDISVHCTDEQHAMSSHELQSAIFENVLHYVNYTNFVT